MGKWALALNVDGDGNLINAPLPPPAPILTRMPQPRAPTGELLGRSVGGMGKTELAVNLSVSAYCAHTVAVY